jgi:rare lipoprotein A
MKRRIVYLTVIAAALSLFAGCAGTPRYTTSLDQDVTPGQFHQTGMASYYAREFNGRKTSSGDRYAMNDFTAAHPTLPFGTHVKVTNFSNNQSVVVRVNDRGPHKKSRIIDVSFAAAKKIGLIASGTARVSLEVVK